MTTTEIDAMRVAAGQCRHCGGAVPCASPFGDVRVGVSHAAATLGRKGGSQRTPAQTAARQTNGRKGGRPRTTIEVVGNPFDAEDAGIPCPCCLDGHIRYLVLRGTGQWRCDECGRRWSYQRDARTINAPLVRGTMVRAR